METLKEYLEYQIERGRTYAFSIDPKESLLHVLKNETGLKKTRMAALREAAENYRKQTGSNVSSEEHLLEDGKIIIWDLEEELERLGD